MPRPRLQYTAGTCHLTGSHETQLTFSRFVHLENAYEFAEEFDKPLCTYTSTAKHKDTNAKIRGQFDLLYVVQLLRINQL